MMLPIVRKKTRRRKFHISKFGFLFLFLVLNSEMAAMLAGEYNCEVIMDNIEGEDLLPR